MPRAGSGGGLNVRVALLLLLLGGCTTVGVNDATGVRWLVGVVRVDLPARQGKLTAVDVKTLGAGWDNGPFLGWRAGNWIAADPSECQLLIVIKSPAAAENAAKVLKSLEGQKPCVADFTRSLRP